MILFGSSLSDGNRHDPNNLPDPPGRTRRRQNQVGPPHRLRKEHAALQSLRLDARPMGTPVESFGDSTEPLEIT